MSYGYETLLTPLQILTYYNAIANDGKMVKPRFEKEIKRNGVTVKTFTTEVIAEDIVSKATIKKAKQMLEGVVQNGSGKGLNITAFKVGGKTGTAQIATGSKGYGTTKSYQASFIGYFPADNPLYTCLVVVYNPSKGAYYGGLIAGPVFKEIAEKVYSSSLDFMQPINNKEQFLTKAPESIKSRNDELVIASQALKLKVKPSANPDGYAVRTADTTKISLAESNVEAQLKKGIVPNLNGMSAKDALFLLENKGMHVRIVGMGSVKKQSILAGQKFNKGDKITLILS